MKYVVHYLTYIPCIDIFDVSSLRKIGSHFSEGHIVVIISIAII